MPFTTSMKLSFTLLSPLRGATASRKPYMTSPSIVSHGAPGAASLYRKSRPVAAQSPVTAQKLADGRIMLSTQGTGAVNMAVSLHAYNIAGRPIRQFLRNGNNRPKTCLVP